MWELHSCFVLSLFRFSCPVAVSWQWWSMTLWPVMVAAVGSWRSGEARLWRFWSDSTTSRTGAWWGPRTALQPRRASYPAPCSVSLTPGPPWRWRGSSTTKVGWERFHILSYWGTSQHIRTLGKSNWMYFKFQWRWSAVSSYRIQQLLVTSMHIWTLEILERANRMHFLFANTSLVTCRFFTSHQTAAWGSTYVYF